MHIPTGVLSGQIVVATSALAAGGVALGLRNITEEKVPRAGLLAAMFFVASLAHVPLPGCSAHLLLNGLAGLALGWAAFPALLVGLLLQALLFGFGGLDSLGANTVNMAFPAVLTGLFIRDIIAAGGSGRKIFFAGFFAGALPVLLAGLFTATTLYCIGDPFLVTAGAIFLAHIPVMFAEGIVTAFAVKFIIQTKPEIFLPAGVAD